MEVYKKLMVVQQKLKSPKNQNNTFGKYKYRSCEDILEALKPCLAETNTVITISDEILSIDSRFYIKATVKFIDVETGDAIETSALAREDEIQKGMSSSQVTGSVSSYARKYSLNGLFCIDDTKDADTMDNKTPTDTPKQQDNTNTPTDNTEVTVTAKMLIDMGKSKGYDEAYLCNKYKVKEIKFIKQETKKNAYETLMKLPNKL